MSAKQFAEKLNRCLDETGAPPQIRQRSSALSKLLDIPKQQALSLLQGHQIPNDDIISKIASEFEIEHDWLSGKN